MATLTSTQIDRTGAVLALTEAASGGDVFQNTGHEFVQVANGNAGATRTVTFAITKLVDGVTPAGKAVTIPLSTTELIGPFPTEIYNNSDGNVSITYSDSAADVTLQVLRM